MLPKRKTISTFLSLCSIAWLIFYFRLGKMKQNMKGKPTCIHRSRKAHKVVSCGRKKSIRWDLWNCTVNVVNNSYEHHCEHCCLIKCVFFTQTRVLLRTLLGEMRGMIAGIIFRVWRASIVGKISFSCDYWKSCENCLEKSRVLLRLDEKFLREYFEVLRV